MSLTAVKFIKVHDVSNYSLVLKKIFQKLRHSWKYYVLGHILLNKYRHKFCYCWKCNLNL